MDYKIADAIPLLERTPAVVAALLGGLPAVWTEAIEGPESWSPRIVVAHLLHADRTNWIPRARTIREHGRAVRMPAFDQSAQLREFADTPLPDLLRMLTEQRAVSVSTLKSWQLDDKSLALEGEHPEFGRVTLSQLLASWVAHDLAHLAQINRTLAKQYGDAVGPWRVYLPIMNR